MMNNVVDRIQVGDCYGVYGDLPGTSKLCVSLVVDCKHWSRVR